MICNSGKNGLHLTGEVSLGNGARAFSWLSRQGAEPRGSQGDGPCHGTRARGSVGGAGLECSQRWTTCPAGCLSVQLRPPRRMSFLKPVRSYAARKWGLVLTPKLTPALTWQSPAICGQRKNRTFPSLQRGLLHSAGILPTHWEAEKSSVAFQLKWK